MPYAADRRPTADAPRRPIPPRPRPEPGRPATRGPYTDYSRPQPHPAHGRYAPQGAPPGMPGLRWNPDDQVDSRVWPENNVPARCNPRLTPNARAVYAYLSRIADPRDRTTKRLPAQPGALRIAAEVGIDEGAARRALSMLEKSGYLTIVRWSAYGRGEHGTVRDYTVRGPLR